MIPVLIMGSTLEIAKITTAIWLHVFWNKTRFLFKFYLTTATIILMLITSMGIFGYLSKAHIEQSAAGLNVEAQIQQLENAINQHNNIIERAELSIDNITQRTISSDAGLQEKIKNQQDFIIEINDRLNSMIAIQSQMLEQISSVTAPIEEQLQNTLILLTEIRTAVEAQDVRSIQFIVGAEVDGTLGTETKSKLNTYISLLTLKESNLRDTLVDLRTQNSSRIIEINDEITRLQQTASIDIQQANDVISSFRTQLVDSTLVDNTTQITDSEQRISTALQAITVITNEIYELQQTSRNIEIEVGPVKYLAELIYGSTDLYVIEKSVRLVIIILIFVFDPLAIILVIAGISTMRSYGNSSPNVDTNETNTANDEDTYSNETVNGVELTTSETITNEDTFNQKDISQELKGGNTAAIVIGK